MAAVAGMRTTMRQAMMTCPACERPIEAELAIKASPPDGEFTPVAGKQLTLDAELVGVKLDHDCLPKATRERATRTRTPRPAVAEQPNAKAEAREMTPAEHRAKLVDGTPRIGVPGPT